MAPRPQRGSLFATNGVERCSDPAQAVGAHPPERYGATMLPSLLLLSLFGCPPPDPAKTDTGTDVPTTGSPPGAGTPPGTPAGTPPGTPTGTPTGTTPTDPAPSEIAPLSLWLFRNAEAADDVLAPGLENLRVWLLGADLDGPPADRAIDLPILQGDDLGGLSIPAGAAAEDQIPVGLPARSSHTVADHTRAFTDADQVCLASGSTIWAERTFLGGLDCFADLACDLSTTTGIRRETILMKVWLTEFEDYHPVALDDGVAVVSRRWTTERFEFDSRNGTIDQIFELDVWIPDGDDTLRWTASWTAIDALGMGDDLQAALARDAIDEENTFADEYLDDAITTCRNDRGADRPTD